MTAIANVRTLKKAQLVEQLEAAHVAYERLATERDSLRAELEQLKQQRPTAQASKPNRRVTPAAEQPAAPSAYRLALARARELAMRTGRSVRVTND